MKKNTYEKNLSMFIATHGDKYDYSLFNEENNKGLHSKIPIICRVHGIFEQEIGNHINGQGCPKCQSKRNYRYTTEEVIKKFNSIHGGKYDYSRSGYKSTDEKIDVICHELDEFGDEHGLFRITPHSHLQGVGCPKCANKYGSQERFIKLARLKFNGLYGYDHVVYKNAYTKVNVSCPIHGDFAVTPNMHLQGKGCPKCNQSRLERDLAAFFDKNDINYIFQQRFEWLRDKMPLSLDFFLPDYNIAIECQGEQHFSPINFYGGEEYYKLICHRDSMKYNLCKEHDIRILYYSHVLQKSYIDLIFNEKEELLNYIKVLKTQ